MSVLSPVAALGRATLGGLAAVGREPYGALVPALICGRFKRWIGFFIGGLYIVYLEIMFACFGV